jgi:hypothetical protein
MASECCVRKLVASFDAESADSHGVVANDDVGIIVSDSIATTTAHRQQRRRARMDAPPDNGWKPGMIQGDQAAANLKPGWPPGPRTDGPVMLSAGMGGG